MTASAAGVAHGVLAGLFSQQSSAYAAFRPRYPPQLYQAILPLAGLEDPGARGLAVDLGRGSRPAHPDPAAPLTPGGAAALRLETSGRTGARAAAPAKVGQAWWRSVQQRACLACCVLLG